MKLFHLNILQTIFVLHESNNVKDFEASAEVNKTLFRQAFILLEGAKRHINNYVLLKDPNQICINCTEYSKLVGKATNIWECLKWSRLHIEFKQLPTEYLRSD